jgi:hypothetical protein
MMNRLMTIGMALFIGSAAAQEAPALADQEERLSYALGMNAGNRLRDLSLHVNTDRYMQGFRDALSGGATLLSAAEAQAILTALQRELKRRPTASRSGEPLKYEQGSSAAGAAAATAALADIKVTFKLDPRLTRGMYMGDRWVSLPTYTRIQEPGKPLTVDARVEGRDAKGQPMSINPEWLPSDPGMVDVAPAPGGMANITVKHAGESRLKIAAGDVYRELHIRAKSENDALQVEIVTE